MDGPAGVDEMAGPFFTLAVDKANTHFEGTFTMTAEQVGRFDDAGDAACRGGLERRQLLVKRAGVPIS